MSFLIVLLVYGSIGYLLFGGYYDNRLDEFYSNEFIDSLGGRYNFNDMGNCILTLSMITFADYVSFPESYLIVVKEYYNNNILARIFVILFNYSYNIITTLLFLNVIVGFINDIIGSY